MHVPRQCSDQTSSASVPSRMHSRSVRPAFLTVSINRYAYRIDLHFDTFRYTHRFPSTSRFLCRQRGLFRNVISLPETCCCAEASSKAPCCRVALGGRILRLTFQAARPVLSFSQRLRRPPLAHEEESQTQSQPQPSPRCSMIMIEFALR
jgi:hypothetical protein